MKGINKIQILTWATVKLAQLWCGHCQLCQRYTRQSCQGSQCSPQDMPDGPWQNITANYFTHMGREYLLICQHLQQISIHLQNIHQDSQLPDPETTRLYLPVRTHKRIFTNKEPPFSSKELTKYLQKQQINHITSSPLYPRPNGFIERQVRTVKTALNITQAEGTPSYPSPKPMIDTYGSPHTIT